MKKNQIYVENVWTELDYCKTMRWWISIKIALIYACCWRFYIKKNMCTLYSFYFIASNCGSVSTEKCHHFTWCCKKSINFFYLVPICQFIYWNEICFLHCCCCCCCATLKTVGCYCCRYCYGSWNANVRFNF